MVSLLLILVLTTPGKAIQKIKLAGETESYIVLASNRQVNRLIFPFRVKKLTSSAENLDIKFEGNTVNLSITGKEPAELIVYAVGGKSYLLKVVPQDTESETVIFEVEKRPELPLRESYLKAIKDLVMAGYRGETLPGYEVREIYRKVEKKKKKGECCDLYIIKEYRSSQGLTLTELAYVNTLNRTVHLHESDFLDEGVRAVSIDKRTLNPKEITSIFVVR